MELHFSQTQAMECLQTLLFNYHKNPSNYTLKISLSEHLVKNNFVSTTLVDGQQTTPRQLLLEVLEVNPRCDVALNNIGALLADGETIVLPDKRVMDKRSLFMAALKHNFANSEALFNIADSMQPAEIVKLPSRRCCDEKQIYKLLAAATPPHKEACTRLAWMMNHDELIKLRGIRRVGKIAMLLFRLSMGDVTCGDYIRLAQCLDEHGDMDKIWDTTTGRMLTLTAMQLFPKVDLPYFQLAAFLRPGETIELPSGEIVDSKELFVRGLDAPHFDLFADRVFALQCLREKLGVGESIVLKDGIVVQASTKRHKY